MAKRNDGMHELPSGLTHFADSIAGGVRGTFIDRFGPPIGPTERYTTSKEEGFGVAPDLHQKFFHRKAK